MKYFVLLSISAVGLSGCAPPATYYVPSAATSGIATSASTSEARTGSTYSAPRPITYRSYHRGPRGGCYYINSSGNRTYVDRSLCR